MQEGNINLRKETCSAAATAESTSLQINPLNKCASESFQINFSQNKLAYGALPFSLDKFSTFIFSNPERLKLTVGYTTVIILNYVLPSSFLANSEPL